MTDPAANPPRRFSSAWDQYVGASAPQQGAWPGDEWGDATLWRAWFARLFEPFGVARWQRAVEIGQGSGKYTELVLRAGNGRVLALDVSPRFQAACAQRLAADVASGRLLLRQIDELDPDALANGARAAGWERDVDAVYSIDTLVHLTVTQLTALLLSATQVLAPNGVFVGTFADASSERGQQKLLADVDRVIRGGGDPLTGCFHWTSPDVVRALARRCGYTVELCEVDPMHQRDGQFVLRFTDPAAAAAANALRARA